MENLYPPGPAATPAELTAPGPAYKRQAKVALLSLLLFIALYLSLTAWFGWTAYNYFVNASDFKHGPLIAYGLAGRGIPEYLPRQSPVFCEPRWRGR